MAEKTDIVPTSDKDQEINKRWFIPVNRSNLSDFLAGGVIVPSAFLPNYERDIQCFSRNHILIIKNGISTQFVQSKEFVGDSGFIILLEIEVSELDGNLICGIDEIEGGGEITHAMSDNYAPVLFYSGVIPVTKIISVHFMSDVDMKNFVIRGFENVPSDIVCCEVSGQLFDIDISGDIFESIRNFTHDDVKINHQDIYEQYDSLLGSIALLVNVVPATKAWFKFLNVLLTSKGCNDLSSIKSFNIIDNDLEQRLFEHVFKIMIKLNTSGGWRPKEILNDFYSDFDKTGLVKEDLSKIQRWHEICLDIIDNKHVVTPLSDENMKVCRAILLLLLRPDPTDIINSQNTSLEPGDEVLALAIMLSGARYGLEQLPNNLKSISIGYGLYANMKSDYINCNLQDSDISDYKEINLVLQMSDCGQVGTRFSLILNDSVLVAKENQGPIELRMAMDKAQISKITLKPERGMNRLKYRYEFQDNRHQIVYISVGNPTAKGDKTVRLWSPCLDISTSKGKKILSKDMALRLLEKNAEPDIFCRFAINRTENIVMVLMDQIVIEMDSHELEMLEHVAFVADNLEKEFGLDVF
jgi:hypothetical protein